jgi:hypothetical protein
LKTCEVIKRVLNGLAGFFMRFPDGLINYQIYDGQNEDKYRQKGKQHRICEYNKLLTIKKKRGQKKVRDKDPQEDQ